MTSAAPVFRSPWFWGALAALAILAWVLFQSWSTPSGSAMKALERPGGAKIQVSAGGFVDSLNAFLSSSGAVAPGTFTFDDLHFETGSATLSKAPDTQLAQLAAVLKAYPKATISVRGHTDNTGDAEANKKLSGDRAAAVKQALVERGVSAAQIESEGRGSEQPVASKRFGGGAGPQSACRADRREELR